MYYYYRLNYAFLSTQIQWIEFLFLIEKRKKKKIVTLSREDHVPSLSRCIITSDLSVKQTSTNVRCLGLKLVHNHTFFIFLGFFHNLSSRGSLSSHLGSNWKHSPTSTNIPIVQRNLQHVIPTPTKNFFFLNKKKPTSKLTNIITNHASRTEHEINIPC